MCACLCAICLIQHPTATHGGDFRPSDCQRQVIRTRAGTFSDQRMCRKRVQMDSSLYLFTLVFYWWRRADQTALITTLQSFLRRRAESAAAALMNFSTLCSTRRATHGGRTKNATWDADDAPRPRVNTKINNRFLCCAASHVCCEGVRIETEWRGGMQLVGLHNIELYNIPCRCQDSWQSKTA